MAGGRCFVGTSGWSYAHWGGGRFYPPGLRSGDWLPFYAERFTTVEINASFYRLPQPESVRRWRELTGGRFRFAVKLWRRITHEKRLAGCADELRDFLAAFAALGPRRGPLLVQLPPGLGPDLPRLEAFLADLRRAAGRQRWRVAVEFRHPGWLSPEVYDLLARRGAAVCLADLPRCPVREPNAAPFVYVRRHGPAGGYRGCYTPGQIAADAEQVRGWRAAGRDVYVYYNNDVGGHAVDNARQLREAVGP